MRGTARRAVACSRRPGRRTAPRRSRASCATALRLRGPPERPPDLDVLGAARRALRIASRRPASRRRAPAARRWRRLRAAEEFAGRPRRGSARRPSAPSPASSPGSSPTITPVVFFETESETFAPSASSAAFASSRVKPSSVPVITYWLPVSGPSTGFSSSPTSKRRPSSRSSATSVRFCSSANQPAIASARSGPIPSTSWISSWLASSRLSTEPKWRARLRAVTQPTSGMLSPKRTRENGWAFEASIAAIALPAEISA